MKKLTILLFIITLLLSACVIAPPAATPTVQPTPTPGPDQPGYIFSHKTPFEEWPECIGHPVCYPVGYVRIGNIDTSLVYAQIWEDGYKLFVIYGEAYNDRIIAKPGKWLAVYARGEVYGGNDWPRPFIGDGGNDAFQLMYEQIVDGVLLGEAGEVLFVPLAAVVEWFDPRTDTFGNFDWVE